MSVIGIATLAISAAGYISSQKNTEVSYKNQSFSYRQQAEDMIDQAKGYQQRADDAALQAELAQKNAASTLSHGQNVFGQATEMFGIQRGQASDQLGGARTQIGRSGVDFSGSSRRLVAENAAKMNRDLRAIESNAEFKWDQLMAEREGSIISSENFLKQEKTYDDIAGRMRSRARSFRKKANKADRAAHSASTWWNPFD